MTAMKKFTAIILSAVLFCGILTACGDETEEISMFDLNQALVGFTAEPDNMKYASSSDSNPEELLAHNMDFCHRHLVSAWLELFLNIDTISSLYFLVIS